MAMDTDPHRLATMEPVVGTNCAAGAMVKTQDVPVLSV